MDDVVSDTDLSSSVESFLSCSDLMDPRGAPPVIVGIPNPVEQLALGGGPVRALAENTCDPASGATVGTFTAVWGLVSGSVASPGRWREGAQSSVTGGLKKDKAASLVEGWMSDNPVGQLRAGDSSPVRRLRKSSPSDIGKLEESGAGCTGRLRESSPIPAGRLGESNPIPVGRLGESSPIPVGRLGESSPIPVGRLGESSPIPVGRLGESSPIPAGRLGESNPIPVGRLGESSPIPVGRLGESSPIPVGRLGESSPIPVGRLGESSPIPAGRLGESNPIPVGRLGESSPIPVGRLGESSPIPVGRLGESSPIPVGSLRKISPSNSGKLGEGSPISVGRLSTPSPVSSLDSSGSKDDLSGIRGHAPSSMSGLRKEGSLRWAEHAPSSKPGLREEDPLRWAEDTPSSKPGLREEDPLWAEDTPSSKPGLREEDPLRWAEDTPSSKPGLRKEDSAERAPSSEPGLREEDSLGWKDRTPSPVTTIVKASPEIQEKEKTLSSATKKLSVVSDKLKYFLKETAGRGKSVEEKLDKVESNKAEVEKALNDHVKYLHSLLDYYHSEQKELLKQRHKDFLMQLMVSKTEELNFEALLTDIQKKVEDRLDRITKERNVKAANSGQVAALCDEYHRRVSSRPGWKEVGQTYLVEIPQVTADDMQAILGHYVFTDPTPTDPTPTTPATPKSSTPYPTPRWPGYEDTPHGRTATRSKGSSLSSSSSQKSAASVKTEGSTKNVPTSASTRNVGTKDSTPPKSGSGDPTQHSKTTGNSATPSLRFSKEQRMKENLAKASVQNVSSGKKSGSQPSVKPRKVSASLDSKQKHSDLMASTSSIASSASALSSQRKKRARSRKQKKKAEAKKETAGGPKPMMITLLQEGDRPKKINGRDKQPRGFAARPNGELWVVYGDRDPHLDRINEAGEVLESYRVGGNTMQAASFSQENVLLCQHSPFCQLKLLDAQKESQETIRLPLIPTGLGVGSTGIAVSSHASVYWIPLDGGKNEWIVEEQRSSLKSACSCDVIIIRGREIVCVADSEGHKVWFFEKLDSDKFTPLPLFTYASHSSQGKATPFSPVCVSSLAGSPFLAVLDAASHSVLMVDVDRNEAVSVIAGTHLCSGVPALLCFALTNGGENPKLWVTSGSKHIYLVSLAFGY